MNYIVNVIRLNIIILYQSFVIGILTSANLKTIYVLKESDIARLDYSDLFYVECLSLFFFIFIIIYIIFI